MVGGRKEERKEGKKGGGGGRIEFVKLFENIGSS